MIRPISLRETKVTDPFWTDLKRLLVDVTLPAIHDQLEATGRVENFRRAARKESGTYEGRYYNDSDVYKWVEAAAYALSFHRTDDLQRRFQSVVDAIKSAAMPDGYINSYFQVQCPDLRWKSLGMMHEMYCGGHMIEAAVAMAEALDDDQLLPVATGFADHLYREFGPEGRTGFCGHPEIELALQRLTTVTGEPKYAALSERMMSLRGRRPSIYEEELKTEEAMKLAPWGPAHLVKKGVYEGGYVQDNGPIAEQSEIVGHAVRAMYLYTAAARAFPVDSPEHEAVRRMWENMTKRRMYVTAGIGSSAHNEGFTKDFDLPNRTAYAETCASIGVAMLGRALLETTGLSEYADIVERALYNGIPSGISLSGDRFFYDNPLESHGDVTRQTFFECACCPPNIARLVGSVAQYLAGQTPDAFYLFVPAGFETQLTLSGVRTRITVESKYPYEGRFTVRIEPEKPVEFAFHLRIPEWADDVSTEVPGLEQEADFENGFAIFRKRWQSGDTITVDLEMAPRWVEADPRVRENVGRAALTLGPVVYAAEEIDNGFAPQLMSVDPEEPVEISQVEGIPGPALKLRAAVNTTDFPDTLYAEWGTTEVEEKTATFIPYRAWNNRGPGSMQVWVRRV